MSPQDEERVREIVAEILRQRDADESRRIVEALRRYQRQNGDLIR